MSSERKRTVSEKRRYMVCSASTAKEIASVFLAKNKIKIEEILFGLPEINDRNNTWKVPVLAVDKPVGDIIIDAYSGKVDNKLSSELSIISRRIAKVLNNSESTETKKTARRKKDFKISALKNTVINARAELALTTLPSESVDLIFTSPPYYNARKQYSEYDSYDDYLLLMRRVIRECKRVLMDGKFFVMNSSHVLLPRNSRSESSSRISVPFDLNQIFIEEGFEFVDDIIWQKPEGAGWVSGRGRRFSADRNPMQYKAVPVTEYVMVYRKKPCILIDHFIRDNPNQEIVKASKIADGYEKTNIWYISPARDRRHPAIFPDELAEKVIRYYSFVKDVVLDPFGGIGTTAKAAQKLGRRFCLIEMSPEYVSHALKDLGYETNALFNGDEIIYKNLLDLKDENNDLESLNHLVHTLMRDGYTEKNLYDQLVSLKKKR